MAEAEQITDPEPEISSGPGNKSSLNLKLILFAVALVVLFFGVRALGLDQWLKQVQPWIASLGPMGPVAYIGIYVAATIFAIPGSAVTIIGGLLFGGLYGSIYVSIGSTLGAAACFLIARYIARDSLLKTFGQKPAFQKLERMSLKQGAWLVALTRLIPLFPFNLLNYGFGLTKVPFWTYVFWSWLCMLPGTVLYVAGTDAVFTGISQGRIPWPVLGLALGALVVLSLVARRAKSALQASETEIGLT